MSVIQTNKWLLDSWEEPLEISEELTRYFRDASASTIYQHLVMHGMYQLPFKGGVADMHAFIKKDFGEVVQRQETTLKKRWNGPNIPIFIFPANPNNRELKENFNGKSGVAFQDKLFLFISTDNTVEEVKALFTHEYHHVCRMSKFNKNISDYDLIDTIILEGLAEHAVSEQVGKDYNAKWTTYYTEQQLDRMWRRLIQPARDLPRTHHKHHAILYGSGLHPKMAGYAVGYYLVNTYMKKQEMTSDQLLSIPPEEIAEITG